MNVIKLTLPIILLIPTILWLMADSLIPNPFGYFSFRSVFVQYSGVIAITVMSTAILLACRPKLVEPLFRGLDKMYRLHKWLGISALVFAVSHWWFAKGTKWMVGWGWLERPARGPKPAVEDLGFWEGLLHAQRGFAESVGEWAFYAAALLMILALIKRFPYRIFVKTHQLLAITYLVFVYHSIVLLKFEYWLQPIGWLMAGLLIMGSFAAIWVLMGKTGKRSKYTAKVAGWREQPDMDLMEVDVEMPAQWPGHRAGQFAFLTVDKKEGAHPFTIASAAQSDNKQIKFIIKALGDYTNRLRQELSVGLPVEIEGPYGCFDFEDQYERQIWIGAGIGITPFVARMKQLASSPDHKTIDFFHPSQHINAEILSRLQEDVAASEVNLHLIVGEQKARLDAEQIIATVPEWQSASIWFCGPVAFGEMLKQALFERGLPEKQFHQELFHFR